MSLDVFPLPWMIFWVALPIVVAVLLYGLDSYEAIKRKRKRGKS